MNDAWYHTMMVMQFNMLQMSGTAAKLKQYCRSNTPWLKRWISTQLHQEPIGLLTQQKTPEWHQLVLPAIRASHHVPDGVVQQLPAWGLIKVTHHPERHRPDDAIICKYIMKQCCGRWNWKKGSFHLPTTSRILFFNDPIKLILKNITKTKNIYNIWHS